MNTHERSDISTQFREAKDGILKLWAERVKKDIPAAASKTQPALYNALPLFLSEIADVLDRNKKRRSVCEEFNSVCKEHGEQRAGLVGYSIGQVIEEYGVLQSTILEVLEKNGPIEIWARDIILSSIQTGICAATTEYVRIQDGMREQFVAILTHDLRNPLSAVKTSVQMIHRVLDRPDRIDTLASRAGSSIKRIEGMIQDLLDTFQIRAGKPLPMNIQPNDLKKVALEAVEELSTVHGARFVLKGPPAAPANFCSDGVRRSIENLANNAVKYGDPHTEITISVSDAGTDAVEVSVHNHGNPLISEEQAKLFQPFHRAPFAKSSGKKGWGLGLTLVQGVAKAHGGTVRVESSEEAGTLFTLQLPKNITASDSRERPS